MSCPRHINFLRSPSARQTLTTLVIALGSTIVLTLVGCASPSGIAPSAKLASPATLGADTTAVVAPVTAEWWRGFDDPVLDDLIARATAGNPSLRVAAARSARAAANTAAADANRSPQVTGSVDAVRQRFSENSLYPPPLAGSVQNTATAQLNGSWELDLFGRNRAQLDAAIGAEHAAIADADAARVLLAVNVARTYVQLARLDEQRDVLVRALEQREEMYSLTNQRVSAGLDTAVELRQSEGLRPETRQQIEATDEQIALARHALAALLAEPPQTFDTLAPKISALRPVAIPEVVPADLVGRRADLVAARWRVEAAAGDVAAQRAQFYPNVNLTAFIGLSTLGLDRLLRASSEQWGVGPAISLPIFDAGRLRAGLSGRTADLDAAVETYNGTLVDAIHDVADQISSTRAVARQQREEDAALASAEAAYDLATQRYRAGLGSYLTVLNAESNVIAQRRLTTDLRARALDAQMLLVRALGGGYVASDETRALASAASPR
ncbi:MAG TPA: efflux transporter outer membrane subunit [Caldimonas sp.]|jgi:NodT family efflux transporter outer membrane factor (OMF) lipoprotein|nr:efflux transporter outer membrane subunit [Caldimonas sp.]HEX4233389.1 efflux transporter outer membrane subunit [Caldimonas sp.]